MLLHGIIAPITTPFYPDGRVYFRKLEHNVDRYSRGPVAGIAVLGSTGEAVMLSDDERRDVLREARQAAADEKVLIAGTGAESAHETLKLTEYAASLGYDAALVRTPHFYRPQMQPENILAFYRAVADRSPLPVMIYNVPAFTGYDIPAEVVIALAEHPNLAGIKESGGNVEKIQRLVNETRHIHRETVVTETFAAVTGRMRVAGEKEAENEARKMVSVGSLVGAAPETIAAAANPKSTLKTRRKDAGFQVLTGSAPQLLESLERGAVGAVIAFADVAPTACFEIYTAWKDRDAALAREKQERIREAADKIVRGYGIPGIKHGLDFNGYYGGNPRLPLLPLTADAKTEIERLLASLRN